MSAGAEGPGRDCSLCPRLVALRAAQRREHADWHNAPVPSFGALSASLLIVGLAPGLKGANRTGRPFTGDYAGNLLYATLGAISSTSMASSISMFPLTRRRPAASVNSFSGLVTIV